METNLKWFKVAFLTSGFLKLDFESHLQELSEELRSRGYIHNPECMWNDEKQGLIVSFVTSGVDAQWAEDISYEVFWDTLFGIIKFTPTDSDQSIQTLYVEPIDISNLDIDTKYENEEFLRLNKTLGL